MRMSQNDLAYSEQDVIATQALNATHTMTAQENEGIVDSLLHPSAALVRQILTRSGRLEHSLILIDDEENLLQALEAGVRLHSLYYSGGAMLSKELIRRLPANIRIYEVAKRTCKKIFEHDKVTRVFGIAHMPVTPSLESLLKFPRDIVALEDLTISGNIGAIVRTSLAFGAGGIVLLNTAPVDIYDRRVIRASRGHIFSIPVVTATTEEFIRFCKQKNLPILVMAAQADHLIHEVAYLSKRLVIVFGSEKEGSSETITGAANLHVQIPIDSKVESLNVSTAAGITLYNRLWFNRPQVRR
jgi:TrmH family RNA methyltransferase